MTALKRVAKNVIQSSADIRQAFLESEAKFLQENEAEINRIYNKELLEGETLTREERALMDRQIAFDMLRNVDNMTEEEMQGVLSTINELTAESVAKLKEKRAQRAAEYQAEAQEVTEQIEETNPELFDEDGNLLNEDQIENNRKSIYQSFKEKGVVEGLRAIGRSILDSSIPSLIRNFMRGQLIHIETITNLADKVVDGKNVFREKVYNRLNRMVENHARGKRKMRAVMNELAKRAGFEKGYAGVKQAMERGIFKETKLTIQLIRDGKTYNKAFNTDELLRIYALSLNEVQRAKLEAQGIDAETLERIKAELGPELVGFADIVVQYLSDVYFDSVNNVYADVNDVNLGFIPNYFPTRTEQSQLKSDMLTDGDFSGIFNADTAPALKDRTDTKGDIVFDASFTGVLENHIDTMEKYKAYAKGVRQLNEFFRIPAVDNLLGEKVGIGVLKTLKQLINNHINPDAGVKASKTQNIIDVLSRKYTGFALAFKVMQIPKQAVSFAMAVTDYSFFGENSNVPKIISNPIDIVMFMVDTATLLAELGVEIFTQDGPLAQAREMSATFDERIAQGLEGDVYGLESGQNPRGKIKKRKTKVGRALRGARTAAGATTAIGDIGGVLGYLVNYRRNIKNGMSQEQAVEAFNNYNATQQTRRGTERTPLQNIRHPIIRPFIMFGSTTLL